MEGIPNADRYGDMLRTLTQSYESYVYYIDVSLKETFKRHKTKHNAKSFGEKEMQDWYIEKDFLLVEEECTIPESSSLEESLDYIVKTSKI